MKKCLSLGVLFAGLATLGGVVLPTVRAEKKDEPAKVDPEHANRIKASEAGARTVAAVATAHDLINFGRSGADTDQDAVKLTRAEALVLAARILKQNPLELLQLPEGVEKAEAITPEKVIDDLIKEAKELGKGDKTLAVQIDRVMEGARGGVGGGKITPSFIIKPGKTTLLRDYYAGTLGKIVLQGGLGSSANVQVTVLQGNTVLGQFPASQVRNGALDFMVPGKNPRQAVTLSIVINNHDMKVYATALVTN